MPIVAGRANASSRSYGWGSSSGPQLGSRGLFAGARIGDTYYNVIDYITITTTGNATDFGDRTISSSYLNQSCSSETRGLFGGALANGVVYNVIDYVTIMTTGNATDFGDLTYWYPNGSAISNKTRGVFVYGYGHAANTVVGGNASINVMEYVTIATTGNVTDFGDMSVQRYGTSGGGDSTRGLTCGGYNSAGAALSNVIDYITISTTGNATDFGDLTVARYLQGGCSSSTRTFAAGGGFTFNTIDYVTTQTLGNATDFGDLLAAEAYTSGVSNATRGVFGQGTTQYITMSTAGNATSFGDLTYTNDVGMPGAVCNGHGGLA